MVQTGNTTPNIREIAFLILKILILFVVLLVGSIFIVPRILHREKLWKSQGSIEGITTAMFFAIAGIAAYIGLSPIVGAFATGMAVASSKLIKQIEEYVHRLQFDLCSSIFCDYRRSSGSERNKSQCVAYYRNSCDNSDIH